MPHTDLSPSSAASVSRFHEDGSTPLSGIWVFGSNEAGRHGKGAALVAKQRFGAVYGQGSGRTGNAYAIPTKDRALRPVPIEVIVPRIAEFLVYAAANPQLNFTVTRVGCGLAGHPDQLIAPLFAGAPLNCSLPSTWRQHL